MIVHALFDLLNESRKSYNNKSMNFVRVIHLNMPNIVGILDFMTKSNDIVFLFLARNYKKKNVF